MGVTLGRMIGAALCALLVCGGAVAQKATVGVQNFENKAGMDPGEAQALVDMITTALAQTGKFDLVERDRLYNVLDEQALGASGAVDRSTAARMGRLTGAQFLLVGAVTEAGTSRSTTNIPSLGVRTGQATAKLAIDIRFVNAETGGIEFAETFTEVRSATGVGSSTTSFSVSAGRTGDLARAVVDKIVEKVMTTVFPPKISDAADPNAIILNYGDVMFAVGEVWEVIDRGAPIKDPDTGEVIAYRESTLGKIKITRVDTKYSEASVVDGGPFTVGAVCRKVSGAPVQSNRKEKVNPF